MSYDNFKTGKEKLLPGVQLKEFEGKWLSYDVESEYDTELSKEVDLTIDGVFEYGYGVWTKFFITNPKRIYEKPERILITSFGFVDSEDLESSSLAVYIGTGNY